MSFFLRTAVVLVPFTALLAACAPGGDQMTNEVETIGELDVGPTKPLLYRNVFGPSFAFNFTCPGTKSCAMQVTAKFDDWTMNKSKPNGIANDSSYPLLTVSIVGCGPDRSQCGQQDTFGWTDATLIHSSYTSAKLPAGTYNVMVNRVDGLPSPDFDNMAVQLCVGGAGGGCDSLVATKTPPNGVDLWGTIKEYHQTDPLNGLGSLDTARGESVELVNPDGTSIAGWLSTSTDGDGNYKLPRVLPGTYALKIRDTLHRVTVSPHSTLQMLEEIDL